MIGTVLEDIRLGEVRLVRCADVAEVRDRLRIWGEREPGGPRVVVCNWSEIPETAAVLDQAIDSLARTALGLWPNWYGAEANETSEARPPRTRLPREVLGAWLEKAAARCRQGRVPRLPKFAHAIEAAQLALAIDPERLHLVLVEGALKGDPGSLLGFARAAEWLAKETRARVVVVAGAELAASSALDSINFKAVDLPIAAAATSAVREEKRSLLVWPFHGNPHPDSPGEQLLAERLSRDAELAGLFAFNQPLRTVRGSSFTVDLVWNEGGLVVEVDGYGWHSAAAAFRQDRQRDYELAISGYTVLRLTHEEIMEDVALALEKIRDVAAYRRLEISGKGDHQ